LINFMEVRLKTAGLGHGDSILSVYRFEGCNIGWWFWKAVKTSD
jgi:hypothetical protein